MPGPPDTPRVDPRVGGTGSGLGTKLQPSSRIGGPKVGRPASLPVSSRVTGTTPTGGRTIPSSGTPGRGSPSTLGTPNPNGYVTRTATPGSGFINQNYMGALATANAGLGSALSNLAYSNATAGIQTNAGKQGLALTNKEQDLNRAGLGVDMDALNRQRGYIEDLFNIANGGRLIDTAVTNVDEAANQRQYGLINMEKGNAQSDWDRYQQMFARQLTGNEEQSAAAKRDTFLSERQAMTKAAAQGDVGVMATMDSGNLQAHLTDQLNELGRNRDQFYADREAAKQAFNTAMVNLNEKIKQTDDNAEKFKLERMRQALMQQEADRRQVEQRALLEDQNKQNFIKAGMIELARRKAEQDWNNAQLMNAAKQQQDLAAWTQAVEAYKAEQAKAAADKTAATAAAGTTTRRVPQGWNRIPAR